MPLDHEARQRIVTAPTTGSPVAVNRRNNVRIRAALAELAEANVDSMQDWLDRTAITDPAKALDFMLRMFEYSVPKLSRVEVRADTGDTDDVADMTISELQAVLREARTLEGRARELTNSEVQAAVGARRGAHPESRDP